MLEFAIRKSESAIGRVVFQLVLAAVAVLGLVWLSIAAAGWLALAVSPPAAAAITGGIFCAIALLAFLISRSVRPSTRMEAPPASNTRGDELISRATRIAERMAPDSPMVALLFALLTGLASVSLPPSLNPFLSKILDDVEKFPDGRVRN